VNVAVVSIGDELLGGRILDTNAAFLSSEVSSLGGRTAMRMTVGDCREAIVSALQQCVHRTDVVLVTGGLGPTPDDLTRYAAADLSDRGRLVDDVAAMEDVRAWCAAAGLPTTEAREAVAKRPPSASFMSNDRGTAPGIALTVDGSRIYMLPGPQTEMQSMWRRHVRPDLCVMTRLRTPPTEVIAAGLTEVEAADRLGDLLDRERRPRLGIRVGRGLVRVSVEDPAGDLDQDAMEAAACDVRARLAPWSFDSGLRSLPEVLGRCLVQRGWVLATAESCTGGGVGAAVTSQSGSSGWYAGGWVTYTNEMKRDQLGVPASLLSRSGPGAVSAEVVRAMAEGALGRSGADLAVAVSGIAGPDGGSEAKPVGTVWIGLACEGAVDARLIRPPGDRGLVRRATVDAALQWARWRAADIDAPLQWEVPS
jgi:nicotinamide-nucleotide amidase